MIKVFSIKDDLLKENGEYSLTRIIAAISFLAFLIGSFYLIWKGITWGNYSTFATFTGGGGMTTQVANKLINSKFNTPAGKWDEDKPPEK
jgi:hypothetical protein